MGTNGEGARGLVPGYYSECHTKPSHGKTRSRSFRAAKWSQAGLAHIGKGIPGLVSLFGQYRPEHIHAPKKMKNTAEQWNYVHGRRGTAGASSQASVLSALMEMGICPG